MTQEIPKYTKAWWLAKPDRKCKAGFHVVAGDNRGWMECPPNEVVGYPHVRPFCVACDKGLCKAKRHLMTQKNTLFRPGRDGFPMTMCKACQTDPKTRNERRRRSRARKQEADLLIEKILRSALKKSPSRRTWAEREIVGFHDRHKR